MFEKLEASSRINDGGSYPYLRSHPLTIERIGDARARAMLGTPQPESAPLEHTLMQARARVLMDPSVNALHRLQAGDAVADSASATDRLAALYASALASTQLRDWARADTALKRADALLHDKEQGAVDARAERAFALLKAQSLLARGQPAASMALVEAQKPDGSRALLMMRAQAAVAEGVAHVPGAALALKQSLDDLQTWTSAHGRDGLAWTELAQTAEQMHLPLRALRAEAEASAIVGDFSGAIDRLRAGQRLSRHASSADFIDASILEARLRDLKRQRRELEEEMRGRRRPGDPSPDDEDSRLQG
jgi:predicted Zn-dependent protease